MTKLSFLLFIHLLIFSHLSAQVDSTKPPVTAVPDVQQVTDTVVRAPRPVHHHDTTHHHRADSTRVVPTHTVLPDTAQAVNNQAVSNKRQDSVVRHDSLVAAPAVNTNPGNGPPSRSFWMKVLRQNSYFNFCGTPVVQDIGVHRFQSKDSLFYLLIGILFYFALVRIFFEKYFGNLITLFFRVSLRQQQIREQVLQTPLPSLLLNILFIISGGLYACFLLHYSRFGANINFWMLYLNCMVGLVVIYLVKFMVLKFCGWVLNISRATDTYIFVVFLANKMMGIFLLPFLIIITFSGQDVREIFITISLVMIFVLLLYRVLAAYRPIRNEIKLTPFHFFLYLCAFEIAPLLLIYKVLLTYLEKMS